MPSNSSTSMGWKERLREFVSRPAGRRRALETSNGVRVASQVWKHLPDQWPMVIVWAMWLIDGVVHSPVPAVNEPQYLSKARHLWNPDWAAGDFFLDSSNPHWGYYVAIGWLTLLMPFEAVAWVGRLCGYGLLAYGWTRLARMLTGSAALAIPAAGIFLLCASVGNLSGEWMVGGIEGKVLAYACLLAGIASWLEARSTASMVWLGATISFHPLVGLWGLLCGSGVEIIARCTGKWARGEERRWIRKNSACLVPRDAGLSLRQFLLRAALLLLCASPGLVAAVMTLGGVTPEQAARATFIQVFRRLDHHLDPTTFALKSWLGYGAMLACCAVVWRRLFRREPAGDLKNQINRKRRRWFAGFVLATVAVALAGLAVGWHVQKPWWMPLRDLRTYLMKFYPFRLADIFVPVAFSFYAARLLVLQRYVGQAFQPDKRSGWRRRISLECQAGKPNRRQLSAVVRAMWPQRKGRGASREDGSIGGTPRTPGRRQTVLRSLLAGIVAFGVSLAIPSPDANASGLSPLRLADWIAVAQWIGRETPPGRVVIIPVGHFAFRWYSDRAVYVSHKDMPQDAAGLLEWYRRLEVVDNWWDTTYGSVSAEELVRLADVSDADYLVTWVKPKYFEVPPIYGNGSYWVYMLPGHEPSKQSVEPYHSRGL